MAYPWKADERAVSPLAGTLMLVAVTTVLAGAFFFYISTLAQVVEPTPPFGATHNDDEASVVIVRSGTEDVDWSQFIVLGCDAPSIGPIVAGQEMNGCSGHVVVLHAPSNTVVYERSFSS